MRLLAMGLSCLLMFQPLALAQGASGQLNIVIVDGEGAMNNIRQRTTREPIVQVEEENHKPVAGAVVVFLLPDQGASGLFANGSRMLTVTTDSTGRAVARGFRPNKVQGKLQIRVTASLQGKTVTATINQTNASGAAGASRRGISPKLVAILAVAGAAAAAGAVAATRGGASPAATPPTTITPGTGAVGPPH